MYTDTGYGGVPDELPSNYGYADSAPSTVHANMETAKALFEPVAQYPLATTTEGRGEVRSSQTWHRPSQHPPSNRAPMQRPGVAVQTAPPQQAPRARQVGPPQFQASGRHTTPSNVVGMRARPTEMQVEPGVPKALRYEDLPGNAIEDDDALGADYGLTAEEKAAKKKAKDEKKAADRAAKDQKKAASTATKEADKAKLRAWQQAAQLGLRFDTARGKWYREVKISGVSDVSTTAKSTTSDRPVLTVKSKGEPVKRAQKLLAEKGFPAGSDGNFTDNMKKQVIAFQTAVGLKVDGKIGKDTWEALDPTQFEDTTTGAAGQVVRQYQDGAVAIMKGAVPSGAAKGAVLSPSKFGKVVSAIKTEVEENYSAFPLPDLTPPPANWDFKLGKMKPGFTLDMDKITKELKAASGKFMPSGKAAAAPEASSMIDTSMSPGTTEEKPTNWLLIGGIAAGVLVIGGLFIAFSGGGGDKKVPSAPAAE